jgi:plastocyanin
MVKRGALFAVACGVLVGIPALARAQDPPTTGSFTAVDVGVSGHWDANGDSDSSSLTVADHGTVTFSYPVGATLHNVTFTSAAKPTCTGVPGNDPSTWGPGWSGTCTFDQPGTYSFRCAVHPTMTGSVTVADPAATPTPPPGASPTPTPTPVYGATPTPSPTATQQKTLKVTLAARQAGRHVRGSVQVQRAHTRLDVSAWAKLTSRKAVRIGRWLKRSAPAGRVTFSVPLIAKARHTLTRRHRLAVTVRIALTPPGGRTLNRAVKTTVRPG